MGQRKGPRGMRFLVGEVPLYKWWHPAFFWIVDPAMINANILRTAHLQGYLADKKAPPRRTLQ